MVLQLLTRLLTDRVGCDAEEVTLAATFDELNVTDDERIDCATVLWDTFVSAPLREEFPPFDTVEDLVGYIEDRMG